MPVVFSTFDWNGFESKVASDTKRLAKLIAGRVGKSTLDPERLLSESMEDPSATYIESAMAKEVWYSEETLKDHAAYDAITMNLLSLKLGKEFKLTFIDEAAIDFTVLSLTTVTIPPGTRKLNPFTDEMMEMPPRISLAEKCGLKLTSFPMTLGRRFRSKLTEYDPDSRFGIHSPADVSTMLEECKKLIQALKTSKERNAASMAEELERGFAAVIPQILGPDVGLFALADT
jgi:hypothetical protein